MSTLDAPPASRCARRAGLLIVLIAAVFAGTPFRAATAASAPDSVGASMTLPGTRTTGESAPLKLDNRTIVEFRGEFLGYMPAQRAAAARTRLREAIGKHRRGERQATVETKATEYARLFIVDGTWVFNLIPADVNALDGQTFDDLVARTKLNLEDALAASLEQRTVSNLVRAILLSVLASVILWLLLRGLIWLVRWSSQRIEGGVHRRTQRLNLPPTALFSQLGALIRGVLRVGGVILGLSLIDIWLTFVLKQFPYTYPWGDQIDDYLISASSTIGLAALHAVPDLLMLALIFVIARFVVRWIRLFFDAVRDGRIDPPGLDADTALPAQRLVILLVWLITVAIAYPFIPGSQGVAFKGLSVLFGLMLSLGSSNVVSQAASGYMLMFSKALRVNDYVRIGDHEGTIMSVGMLSTKIRTPRDEEINVPNAVVVGSITKNYTRLNREIGAPVTTAVTIGYNAPWRQVHAMLLEAAGKTAGLREEPMPRVLQTALSDFYVEYTLFARLEVPQSRAIVLSELHANIQDIFNVHGVQIMSPHYEGDPDGKVWVPKEKWYEAPGNKRTDPPPPSNVKGNE